MIAPALILALLLPVVATAPPAPQPTPFPSRGAVIVLRPPDADEVTRTALSRVTGELTAARFQVTVVPLDPSSDPTPQVENVALESRAVAAFAIAHIIDRSGDTIAIWVSDRLGRRTTIQRMALRGNNISQDSEALALEAIELIRVSIAGLWPAPGPPPQAQEEPTPAPAAPRLDRASPPPAPGRTLALGLGVAILQGTGTPAAEWMGSLTGTLIWPRGLAVRAQVTGLGPGVTVSGAGASATVHRQLASLGLAWFFWRHERVQSMITAGVGVLHLTGSGTAIEPARAHTASAWSAIGTAGIGAAARLGGAVSLTAELDGILTAPPLVLRVADTETEPLSRPGVVVNVGLQATF